MLVITGNLDKCLHGHCFHYCSYCISIGTQETVYKLSAFYNGVVAEVDRGILLHHEKRNSSAKRDDRAWVDDDDDDDKRLMLDSSIYTSFG